MKNIALLLLSLLFFSTSYAHSGYDFDEVDQHARKLKKSSTYERTAERLTEPFANEAEKARAIFTWIADRLQYDIKKFKDQQKRPQRTKITFDARKSLEEVKLKRQMEMAEKAFKREQGVCEDYAYLFQFMCESVGLEAVFIPGYGRNSYRDIDRPHPRSNHAWNAVKIDGKWYLLDVTWAAGNTDMNSGKFTKIFKDGYFMTPPELFILTHFPEEEKWQLLDEPVGLEQFVKMPYAFHELLEPSIIDYFPKNGLLERKSGEVVLGLQVEDTEQHFVLIKNRKMTQLQPEIEEDQVQFRLPVSIWTKGEISIAVIRGKKAKPVISYLAK
jgi:hypothetical protein